MQQGSRKRTSEITHPGAEGSNNLEFSTNALITTSDGARSSQSMAFGGLLGRFLSTRETRSPPNVHDRATLLLFLLVLAFWFLKSFALSLAASEEDLLLYAALRMSDGHLPYADFYFSHPPLSVVPGMLVAFCLREVSGLAAALFPSISSTITEVSTLLRVMKVVPIFAATMTGIMVHALARRQFGAIAAIVATALYYFSYDVLWASSYWTGCNWATMWLFMGAAAVVLHRPTTAGLFLGAAICTEIYVIVPTAVIIGFLRLQNRGGTVRCAALTLAVWLGIGAAFLFTSGGAYLSSVDSFFEVVPSLPIALSSSHILSTVHESFFLMAGPVCALPIVFHGILTSRHRPAIAKLRAAVDFRKRPTLATLIFASSVWLAHLVFVFALQHASRIHLQPLLPFAAVCGGAFIHSLVPSTARWAHPRRWMHSTALFVLVAAGLSLPSTAFGAPASHAVPLLATHFSDNACAVPDAGASSPSDFLAAPSQRGHHTQAGSGATDPVCCDRLCNPVCRDRPLRRSLCEENAGCRAESRFMR